jgi:hypothetical protein
LHSNANFSYWLDYKWDASFARKETRRLAGSEESIFLGGFRLWKWGGA